MEPVENIGLHLIKIEATEKKHYIHKPKERRHCTSCHCSSSTIGGHNPPSPDITPWVSLSEPSLSVARPDETPQDINLL